MNVHWWVTTLEPLTGDVSSTDHLVAMQCPAGKPWHSGGCQLTHITKTAQEWLKGLNKELKVTTGPPKIPIKSSISGMCRNRSHPWNLTLPTSRNQRIHYWCLGARHHRTPPDDLWPCLYGLEPFRLHKGNLHIIKQVADQCMYVLCMHLSEVFTF